jgi:hypothetical protein
MALHPSVIARFEAQAVPQMGEVRPYRPINLRSQPAVIGFYS